MIPLAGEMDCSNTIDLLSPRQMSSSPESPEAFGLQKRPSESITVFGHSSSASSGSLLGPISVTLGNKINQPGTAASIPDFGFAPPSAHGDKRTLLQVSRPPSFNPSRAPCPRSSVVPASRGFNTRSLDIGGGNTAEFPWVFDTAFGQSTSRVLQGNTVASCSQMHEAELGNVTQVRESISEMGVDRNFIDEGGTTKQSRWSFGTKRSPFGRRPRWSTEESCHGTFESNQDIIMQSGCQKLILVTPVHKAKSDEDLRCQGVYKHASSLDSANSESAKAFVYSIPPHVQTLFNNAFRCIFNEDRSGTVNAFIDAVDRYLVGVDSRSTTKALLGNEAVSILHSDNEVKCEEVVKGFVGTVCAGYCQTSGNVGRVFNRFTFGLAFELWQVAHVCEKISPPPCGSHCIDLAIYLQYKFEDGELFFFDKSSYLKMNFYILTLFFESLGFIRDDWKLFSVRFLSKKESVDLYRMGVRVRGGIRRLMIYGVPMFVATANTGMLNLARNTNFLCEM